MRRAVRSSLPDGRRSPARQLAALWAGVAVALIALAPLATALATRLPPCPVRAWLDLPCPSCGTTRAALALAHLDLAAALAVNPLAAIGWIGLIGGGLAAGAAVALDRPLPELRLRATPVLRVAVAIVLLMNWLYLVFLV